MGKYSYTAKTKDAKLIKDKEEASSREELIARLRSRGLFVISVNEIKRKERKSILTMSIKRSSLKIYDFSFLARNLSTTLGSGVTLLRSLELLSLQTESAKMETILKKCIEDIRGGLSLSEAISRHPQFSTLWRGIVEVGESSGNLSFVLEKLAEYLEMRMDFERKITSSLVYPFILVTIGTGAVVFFMKFLLPKFTDLFSQMNLELPFLTRVLFSINDIASRYFLLIIGSLIFLGIALSYMFKNRGFLKVWHEVSVKLPLLGKTLLLVALERFTSTMNIMLDSGLPLVYSIDVAARSIGNFYMEAKILAVKEKVKEGLPLSDELRRTEIFPPLVAEMARIGEETGAMPDVFKKISVYYQKELTSRIERFITAFEPIMILLMGVVIGAIVISLFLPLFKLSTMGG